MESEHKSIKHITIMTSIHCKPCKIEFKNIIKVILKLTSIEDVNERSASLLFSVADVVIAGVNYM